MNWDKLGTGFVTEYQEALDGLEKDQIVAAPVKSEYGYHIIWALLRYSSNQVAKFWLVLASCM